MLSSDDQKLFLLALQYMPWETRVWTPTAIKAVVAHMRMKMINVKKLDFEGKPLV